MIKNNLITIHFKNYKLLCLLTKKQVGNVVMALFDHFVCGVPNPKLDEPIEELMYDQLFRENQSRIDRFNQYQKERALNDSTVNNSEQTTEN